MMVIFKVFLLTLLVVLSYTQDLLKKSCPCFVNLSALDGFNEEDFMGTWYQQRMYPSEGMIQSQMEPWLDTAFQFQSQTDKILGRSVIRFGADLDCEFQTWRHMYRLVPGKYTWTGRYPNRTMTILGTDYNSYVVFFVCNNPTEDDQCESMQAHGLTRERIPASEELENLEKTGKKLLKGICYPKEKIKEMHVTEHENDSEVNEKQVQIS